MHLHTQFTNGIFVYYVILWGNFINNVFILGIIEKKKKKKKKKSISTVS